MKNKTYEQYDILSIIKEIAKQGSNRGTIDMKLKEDMYVRCNLEFYPIGKDDMEQEGAK